MPGRKKKEIESIEQITEAPEAPEAPVVPEKKTRAKKIKVKEVAVVDKPKRPASKWILALKKFNEGKDRYTIPKKDTDDYNQVVELMKSMSM